LERAIRPPAPPPDRPVAPAPTRRKPAAAIAAVVLLVLLSMAAWRLGATPPPASSPPPPPGQEAALLASELLADGKWTALRGAVADLRQRAPDHPRLAEFERALAARQDEIERSRKEWIAAMDRLPDGADPDDLR